MPATRHEDILAIDVYQHAQNIGETLTLGFVERRLDELAPGATVTASEDVIDREVRARLQRLIERVAGDET